MKNDYYFHGSDIEKIKEKYKIKNEEIINFAANVNPLGISPQLKAELSNHMDIITTYPPCISKNLILKENTNYEEL